MPSDFNAPEHRSSSDEAQHSSQNPPDAGEDTSSDDTTSAEEKETTSPAADLPGLQDTASRQELLRTSERLRNLLASAQPVGARNLAWATLVALVVTAGLMAFTGRLDSLAQGFMERFRSDLAEVEAPLVMEAPEEEPRRAFTFQDLTLHPDAVFQPYTAGSVLTSSRSEAKADRIQKFRELLDLHAKSRGQDSNFSIRVVDSRTGELLELYTLEGEKAKYEQAGEPMDYNWGEVDDERRQATRRLVDKYKERGIPSKDITVKWGRAQQVQHARQREIPYIEYEVALARYFGLSLLVTEIGTVETFNRDELVSPVNARSRYQMMPYVLRQENIHRYSLSTPAGNKVHIQEELHPLITMEPAFLLLRGYINAVGHEIPGMSAYHTGPGNIFKLYRAFLTHESENFSPNTSVMDAYMWAVTDGYETVSKNSSFGSYSRGYVASAYGSLKGTDGLPIDTSQTLRTDRVALKDGESIHLSELLRALGEQGHELDWGPEAEGSLYERFRYMNPHFNLPEAEGEGVPVEGNVRITSRVEGNPVRFFLPLGARDLLREKGHDLFDPEALFTFDQNTYPNPDRRTKTIWDRQYDNLVQNISRFGFTPQNRRHLFALQERFEYMAEENPTHYRKAQLKIINTHARIWGANVFDKLATVTQSVMGERRTTPRPPDPLSAAPSIPSLGQ